MYTIAQGEGSAGAAAEQLMAEEAREAAKAAAKKAKKQKAKARKQQACSDATSASETLDSQPSESQAAASHLSVSSASAGPSMQTQQDMEPVATRHQNSPPEGRGDDGLSHDQGTDSFQQHRQHRTTSGSAMHSHRGQNDQVSTSAGGLPAGGAKATDASPEADAEFLDQLFCCPITKVNLSRPLQQLQLQMFFSCPGLPLAVLLKSCVYSENVCLGKSLSPSNYAASCHDVCGHRHSILLQILDIYQQETSEHFQRTTSSSGAVCLRL